MIGPGVRTMKGTGVRTIKGTGVRAIKGTGVHRKRLESGIRNFVLSKFELFYL